MLNLALNIALTLLTLMVTLSGNPNPTNPYMPCLFTTTEVSVRRQKSWEVGIWRIPVYTPDYSPVYSTVCGY